MDLIPTNGLKIIANTEAFLASNLKEILYDISVNEFRTRFSIGHEIGHIVFHSNEIKLLRVDSYTDWKNVIATMPGAIWGRAEYQARQFAGRLLVPRDQLINELKKLKPQISQAIQKVPNLTGAELNEYLAKPLSKIFEVSAAVILTRLDNEKIDPLSI